MPNIAEERQKKREWRGLLTGIFTNLFNYQLSKKRVMGKKGNGQKGDKDGF